MKEASTGLAAALEALTDEDKIVIGRIARAVYDDEALVQTLSEPINYSFMQIEKAFPALKGITFGDDENGDSTDYETFLMISSMDESYRKIIKQVRIPL